MGYAGFDHLVFLPSGDSGLMHRVKRYSDACLVVVKFNRDRKRYERQGILIKADAIRKEGGEGKALSFSPIYLTEKMGYPISVLGSQYFLKYVSFEKSKKEFKALATYI